LDGPQKEVLKPVKILYRRLQNTALVSKKFALAPKYASFEAL
jgi:hypothetical protein